MGAEKEKYHILVIAAVTAEASEVRARMKDVAQDCIGGRRIYEGTIGPVPVRLMETGPGMVNTAQSLTAAIEDRLPAMILMTGCAGGFHQAGMGVGDIGVATEENDAQLGIESVHMGHLPEPLPFDLGVKGGISVGRRLPVSPRLSGAAPAVLAAVFKGTPVNILSGPFVTVSTVTATDRRAERLYGRFRACMESMEGSAGAHVAMHYGIPFLEIRCASNRVGKRNLESWELSLACRRSGEAAVGWILARGSEIADGK